MNSKREPSINSIAKAFKAIGYSNDYEQVFIIQDGFTPDGQPMEFSMIWTPETAMKVANLLMQAAKKCLNEKSPIILPRLRVG